MATKDLLHDFCWMFPLACHLTPRGTVRLALVASVSGTALQNQIFLATGSERKTRNYLSKKYNSCTTRGDSETAMSTAMNASQSALQGIVKNNETNGWDAAWVQKVTPWDLGGVHPVIENLVATGSLPTGRVLVPGCGSGWDVVALAGPTRHVVGLDLSETATSQARKAAEGKPGAPFSEFVSGNFFDYAPSAPFDLIFDYTFFCALNPSLRPEWAKKMAQLLLPGGELITLMFPLDEYSGGPPYAVSEKAYEDALGPSGLECHSLEPVQGPKPRLGKEKLGRWRKYTAKM